MGFDGAVAHPDGACELRGHGPHAHGGVGSRGSVFERKVESAREQPRLLGLRLCDALRRFFPLPEQLLVIGLDPQPSLYAGCCGVGHVAIVTPRVVGRGVRACEALGPEQLVDLRGWRRRNIDEVGHASIMTVTTDILFDYRRSCDRQDEKIITSRLSAAIDAGC